MSLSYWEQTTFFKDLDVAIIGSGIVGLNAALSLKKKNKKHNYRQMKFYIKNQVRN